MIYFFILGICILANFTALTFQLLYHELPCPLCLLQRFGFLSIALGALLSVTHGNSWRYKLIIVISSLFTFAVGFRQVLIHIEPNDPGYGSPFLGLHFYTWSAITSFGLITLMSLSSLVNFVLTKIFSLTNNNRNYYKTLVGSCRIILLGLAMLNTIFVLFECGYGLCPPNPNTYMSLDVIKEMFQGLYSKKVAM